MSDDAGVYVCVLLQFSPSLTRCSRLLLTNLTSSVSFDSCYIEQGANAASGTSGNVYLGRFVLPPALFLTNPSLPTFLVKLSRRPWRAYSRVIYQFCSIAGHINPLGWESVFLSFKGHLLAICTVP
jgi:hypothetical protein